MAVGDILIFVRLFGCMFGFHLIILDFFSICLYFAAIEVLNIYIGIPNRVFVMIRCDVNR